MQLGHHFFLVGFYFLLMLAQLDLRLFEKGLDRRYGG
jgi:hypothetical protein